MSKQATPVATKNSPLNTKFKFRGEKYHLGETTVAYTLLAPTISSLIVLFVLPLIILLVLSLKQSAGSGNFSAFYLPITLSLLLRFLALIRWKGSVDLSLSLTIRLRPMICCL